jgi:sulfatase maturation enzyme AslB (radical SAM superfamily)
MNANDFYILSYDLYDTIFHIPSSHIISLKKGTNIYYFFRQLLLNEISLTSYEFLELEKLIINEFDFIKQTNNNEEYLSQINLQSIILPISGHCNLRCSYCFAQTKGNFGFNDIDVKKAKRIIDYAFSNNNSEFECNVYFFGGEPLLNIRTIEETIKYVKKNYPNRNVSFGITTNGIVLNKRILELIKGNNIKLLLSYDGPSEFGSHRTYVNGKCSDNKVLKNIDILRKEGVKFQLRATITSDCENIKNIHEYFESLNIPFAAILAYKSRNIDESCIYEGK